MVRNPTVAYSLAHLGATPMDARYPVLAVGSNAAPRQLAEKLSDNNSAIVVTRCRVTNIGLAYAQFEAFGYLPLAAVVAKGKSRLSICWLDWDQLNLMRDDEGRGQTDGYHLESLDVDRFPATLDGSGERLGQVLFFRPNNFQVHSRTMKAGDAQIKLDTARSQQREDRDDIRNSHCILWDGLGNDQGEGKLPDGRRAADFPLPTYGSQKRSQWAAEDGFLCLSATAEVVTELPGIHAQVRPTGLTARSGEFVAKMTEGTQTQLFAPFGRHSTRRPRHVLVSALDQDGIPRSVVARLEGTSQSSDDELELDETLRQAIGVNIHEHVRVTPVSVPRHRLGNFFIGSPRYLMARVVRGEFGLGESDRCGLPEIAARSLGVQSGDQIVLESVPNLDQGSIPLEVQERYLEAVPIPSDADERRRLLTAGGRSAWYPSPAEVLGVGVDLPEVALDDDARKKLSVELLDAVRIRVRRRSQATLELRESIYLVGLSLFVAIAMIYDIYRNKWAGWWVALLLLIPIALVFAVVVLRLRTRFRARTIVPTDDISKMGRLRKWARGESWS